MKGSNAEKYIKFGEANQVDEVACLKNRRLWYSLGKPEKRQVVLPYSYDASFKTFFVDEPTIADKRLVQCWPSTDSIAPKALCGLLNSTFWFLFLEISGNSNLGEGALVFNTKDFSKIPTLDLTKMQKSQMQQIELALDAMKNRNIGTIFDELEQPDRQALDEIIFDAFTLSKGEREAVYEATLNLVEKRLGKAKSLESDKGLSRVKTLLN